jgi:hypothetical protein
MGRMKSLLMDPSPEARAVVAELEAWEARDKNVEQLDQVADEVRDRDRELAVPDDAVSTDGTDPDKLVEPGPTDDACED